MKSTLNFVIVLLVSSALFTLFFFFTLPLLTSGNGIPVTAIPTFIIAIGGYLIWRYQSKGYKMIPLKSPIAILGFSAIVLGSVLIYMGLSVLFTYVTAYPENEGLVSWQNGLIRSTYYQVISGSVLLLIVALSPYTVSFNRTSDLHVQASTASKSA